MTSTTMENEVTKEEGILKQLKQCARIKEIKHYYDVVQWQIGKTYRIRVGHIYDLSKFWIVHLEKELTVFQDYLNSVYSTHSDAYRIRVEDVATKMYCITYSEKNYCRGVIVDIPCLGTSQINVVVFLIDFGFIVTVSIDNLYYLFHNLYQVPRFAIRASINKIFPNNGDTWTMSVVKRFNELVSGKVLLCIVEMLDSDNKVLYITMGEVDQNSRVQDIRDVLLSEKSVKSLNWKRVQRGCRKSKLFMPNTLCPSLLPTFEALEGGTMPSSVLISDILKNFKGSATLFKPYYSLNSDDVMDSINSSLTEKTEKLESSYSSNKSKIDCNELRRSHFGSS